MSRANAVGCEIGLKVIQNELLHLQSSPIEIMMLHREFYNRDETKQTPFKLSYDPLQDEVLEVDFNFGLGEQYFCATINEYFYSAVCKHKMYGARFGNGGKLTITCLD